MQECKSIFEFDHHLKYIKYRIAKDGHGIYTFSEAIGKNNHTYMANVMASRRAFKEPLLLLLCRHWRLSQKESAYFRALMYYGKQEEQPNIKHRKKILLAIRDSLV